MVVSNKNANCFAKHLINFLFVAKMVEQLSISTLATVHQHCALLSEVVNS